MGSVTHSFLADSLLFHESSLKNNYENETESRIQKEVEEYRNFTIQNYDDLIQEIVDRKSFLKVFSSKEHTPVRLLKQTALYIDQYILPDPVFSLSEAKNPISNVTSKYLGYNESKFEKQRVAKACHYLKSLTPMIAGDYVKLFPLSYYFERPRIPFYLPTDGFNKVLPAPILDYFKGNAEVCSLEKIGDGAGWRITDKLYPCRGITVEFKNAIPFSGMIFHLTQQEIIEVDKEKGIIKWRDTLPDTPPSQEDFDAWVFQSINSTARKFFNEVFVENQIAANLNATYLCDNTFTSTLIANEFGAKESVETFTATQMINIEVPFLDKIDTEKLMTVREHDADIFTNFRIELEKQFRELRSINDESILKLKTENILHELNDVQGQKIKQKMAHIKKQMGINTILAIGGLIASFPTGGASLAATALAIGKGYKDYADYKEKVTENPAFLLWKVINSG